MNCTYLRQISDKLPYEQLQKPEDFKEGLESVEYYKNIVAFTHPTTQESVFYVQSVGYEISPPNQSTTEELSSQKTVFYFVLGGEGLFNGRTVRHGDCFIATQSHPYSIEAKPGREFECAWIAVIHPTSFSLSTLGLDPEKTVFRYSLEAELRQIIYSMQNFNTKRHDVYFFTMGKFFEIIALLRVADTSKVIPKTSSDSHARYVALTKNMLEESEYRISIEEISKAIGFSRKYLSMIFCQTMGITLRDYITQKKIERAKAMLSSGEASLKTIAFQLNYNDYSSFSRAFKKESGLTPHEYVSAQKKKTEG